LISKEYTHHCRTKVPIETPKSDTTKYFPGAKPAVSISKSAVNGGHKTTSIIFPFASTILNR
jgi:hypothetical protein